MKNDIEDSLKNHGTPYDEQQAAERAALDLYLTFEKSGADHFTVQLYRLIAKADGSKRRRIAKGFPLHCAMYEEWMITPDRHTFYEKYHCARNYRPDSPK